MPSHEDYLDSLLRNLDPDAEKNNSESEAMGDSTENPKNATGEINSDFDLEEEYLPKDAAVDLDDDLDLDEDFDLDALLNQVESEYGASQGTERFLTAGGEREDAGAGQALPQDEDLPGMLGDAGDSDLLEINELLGMSDSGGADKDTAGPLQNATEEAGRVLSRKEKAAAKKAAKEAARAAKAAAKAAAKEARAAAKAAKRAKGAQAAPVGQKTLESPAGKKAAGEQTEARISEEDDFFDTSLLDSIVSEADRADAGSGADAGLTGGSDLSGPEAQGDVGGSAGDDLGLDMDSLFGDGDDSQLGAGDDFADGDVEFSDLEQLHGGAVNELSPDGKEGEEEKKGLFSKIFAFLTEEDSDDESDSIRSSDENREILNDLDKEEIADKKKKKSAKAKPKKAKPKKAKPAKKPKPKKPKKEKIPEPEPLIPERRLTLKRVLPVVLVGVSVCVLLLVLTNGSVDYTDRKTAREAYHTGDYQTCYQNLYGKDLNETEQIMFAASESMLRIRLWLREYEMFVEAGSEIEALDSLIRSVEDYPDLYAYAVQWNVGEAVKYEYNNILNILLGKYGLTESQALEIAHVRSDMEYTLMIVTVVEGGTLNSWDEPSAVAPGPQTQPIEAPLPDELPEEDELGGSSFIDNQ